MKKNPASVAAAALGAMGKGRKKTLTPEQRRASGDRMRAVQKLRWQKPLEPQTA